MSSAEPAVKHNQLIANTYVAYVPITEPIDHNASPEETISVARGHMRRIRIHRRDTHNSQRQ